jgi:hypothetical protein
LLSVELLRSHSGKPLCVTGLHEGGRLAINPIALILLRTSAIELPVTFTTSHTLTPLFIHRRPLDPLAVDD